MKPLFLYSIDGHRDNKPFAPLLRGEGAYLDRLIEQNLEVQVLSLFLPHTTKGGIPSYPELFPCYIAAYSIPEQFFSAEDYGFQLQIV
ncbi:MAG: hypothetical protein ACFFA5_07455 [Promethearchaeota archaeon]